MCYCWDPICNNSAEDSLFFLYNISPNVNITRPIHPLHYSPSAPLMDMTSSLVSPSQAITILHHKGQKKEKNVCHLQRWGGFGMTCMCKYTTGSPFVLCQARVHVCGEGGGVGGGGWVGVRGCWGGLLWSKLYLCLKLKTALSTQLDPDITHLPMLG